jgi:hypothetical protein
LTLDFNKDMLIGEILLTLCARYIDAVTAWNNSTWTTLLQAREIAAYNFCSGVRFNDYTGNRH